MTPLMIEIVLKCYYSHDPAANCIPKVWTSPAAHSARELLIDIGVIDPELRATPKGVAYVRRLLAVDPNKQDLPPAEGRPA